MGNGGFSLLAPALALGSDQELAQQIAGNLKNGGRMKGYSISVKVQGGVVQLDGTVQSEDQREEAISIAEITPGIERVINNLSVKEVKDGSSTLALRHPTSIASGDKQVVRRSNRPTVMSAVRQANAEVPADRGSQAFHYDEPPRCPRPWAIAPGRKVLRDPCNESRDPAIHKWPVQPIHRNFFRQGRMGADAAHGVAGGMGPMPAYGGAIQWEPLPRGTTIRRCRAMPGRATPLIQTTRL